MLNHWCLLMALLFAGVTQAQHTKAIEDTIKHLEQKVVRAILEADTITLKQVWAPEFLVNTPRNNVANSRDAVFENQRQGLINYSSFDRTIEAVQVQSNLVITMGQEVFVSRSDIPGARAGQPVKRRFTNVWIMKNGNWQQIARHASIICP